MPDLRIHEYETRQELFEALPVGIPLYYYQTPNVETALFLVKRIYNKTKVAVWRWKDLVFVGEEDGE